MRGGCIACRRQPGAGERRENRFALRTRRLGSTGCEAARADDGRRVAGAIVAIRGAEHPAELHAHASSPADGGGILPLSQTRRAGDESCSNRTLVCATVLTSDWQLTEGTNL